MKRKTLLLSLILILSFLTFSCQEETTLEEDAVKMGKITCQALKVIDSDENIDIEEFQNNSKKFSKKMKSKYSSELKWKTFNREVEKYIVENCY
ncbi:hypothetical protein [Flavobacteriaceae bacterium 14752]|uniref:hypothetical protein n=1 Tax=Mesohalobacter salilacus TaxID=2491711 RepID=UPI000F6329E0|nr:hypothetical protein EIG84_12185 [Flavobacteriaceae bacterium 14752]